MPEITSLAQSIFDARVESATALFEIAVYATLAVREMPFQAVAHEVTARDRSPVVNAHGNPLVAFGPTPQKAAAYLVSALRRRYGAALLSTS